MTSQSSSCRDARIRAVVLAAHVLAVLVILGGRTPAAAADFTDTAPINGMTLSPGWTGQAFTYNNQLWIRSYQNGVGKFDWRIGPAGVVSEMREVEASYRALLSPPFTNERSDRVIQWTWWDHNLKIPETVKSNDHRFNLTQAGTFGDGLSPRHANGLSPTVSAHVTNSPVPQVDVYAVPQDQWFPSNQPYLRNKASVLTRYRLLGNGLLMIRRVMLIGHVYRSADKINFTQAHFDNFYMEAWTPLKRPLFTSLALRMDANGAPMWWYKAGTNLPAYAGWPVDTTYGYGVVFKEGAHATNPAVGVVYGARHAQSWSGGSPTRAGSYVLNANHWDTGIGVLPGMNYPSRVWPETVVDQYLVIVPGRRMDAAFAANVHGMVPHVPAPRFFPPGTTFDGELASIVSRLRSNMANNVGTRANDLGPLIVP